ATRRAEGARAAAVIGASYHCLEERDLLLFYGERPLAKVTRLLRAVRPRVVLTHSPADYLLDHEVTAALARAAAFAAPVPNRLPPGRRRRRRRRLPRGGRGSHVGRGVSVRPFGGAAPPSPGLRCAAPGALLPDCVPRSRARGGMKRYPVGRAGRTNSPGTNSA